MTFLPQHVRKETNWWNAELMTAPQPPYSPEAAETTSRTNTASTQEITSPGSSFSRHGTPTSSATTLSPDGPSASRSSRPRPVSMIQPSDVNGPYRPSAYFPLPPPPGPEVISLRGNEIVTYAQNYISSSNPTKVVAGRDQER